MLTWVNILHLHQPPHQDEAVLKKVADESYRLILSLLEKYSNLRLTLNVSGSLIELLQLNKMDDVINKITYFVQKNQIELMATPMYHPILPLIPLEEAERQIDDFLDLFKKTFPDISKPKGFFLPEMAYSAAVGELIARKGFSWIVLDEMHAGKPVEPMIRYKINDLPLSVLFRNRVISRHFPPEAIFEYLAPELGNDMLITAHDGELYGHWHRDDKGFYERAFTSSDVRFVLASSYLDSRTKEETIEPKEISWETLEEDERMGASYALWNHPENEIHARMWALAHLCIQTLREHGSDPKIASARKKLDRGLTSCGWWWMSGRKIGPFSPVLWHPSETKKGLDELLASVHLLETASPEVKQKAEKHYVSLVAFIFDRHEKIQPHSL